MILSMGFINIKMKKRYTSKKKRGPRRYKKKGKSSRAARKQ